MERFVCPGKLCRDLKNRLYQVVAVALHSETGERMVVYQALYGDYGIYVQPYERFISEKPAPGKLTKPAKPEESGDFQESEETQEREIFPAPSPLLMDFLDADDHASRMACLMKLSKSGTQADFDSIYAALDIAPQAGTLPEQAKAIGNYLSLLQRYEGRRLRKRSQEFGDV